MLMIENQQLPAGSLDTMTECRAGMSKPETMCAGFHPQTLSYCGTDCAISISEHIQVPNKLVAGPDAAVGMATVGALAPTSMDGKQSTWRKSFPLQKPSYVG